MSLLRLLTAGKCLVGLSDSTARYRMTSRRVLPRFGSANNRFAGPSLLHSADAPPNANGVAEADGGAHAGIAASVNRWTAKVDAWLSWVRTQPPKSTIPKFVKLPVQGELRLDRIKVVRNDLSDADLEVVPVKPLAAAVRAASVLPGIEGTASPGTAWGRMVTRLFDAGNT